MPPKNVPTGVPFPPARSLYGLLHILRTPSENMEMLERAPTQSTDSPLQLVRANRIATYMGLDSDCSHLTVSSIMLTKVWQVRTKRVQLSRALDGAGITRAGEANEHIH